MLFWWDMEDFKFKKAFGQNFLKDSNNRTLNVKKGTLRIYCLENSW